MTKVANLKNSVNPLTWQVPIVNNNGTPTDEFMRKWGQQAAANATIPDLTTAAGVSARLDLLGSSPGMILERGATAWAGMASPSDATKFLNGAALPAYAQVKDSDLAVSDVTTNNVTNLKHGFAPKSPANVTFFLNGGANPAYAAVKDSDLSLSDITTNDVSVAAHGFAPKLPNDATKFLNGLGLWAVPAGGGSGGGAASIQDTGTSLYIALSDADGQLILDGSGNPIFAVDVLPPAALPVASAAAFGAVKPDGVTIVAAAGILSALPSFYGFSYTQAADYGVADSVITKLALPTAVTDSTAGAYSTGTGRFTCPAAKAGRYFAYCVAIGFVNTAMSQTAIWLSKNGTVGGGGTVVGVCSAAQATSFTAQRSGTAVAVALVALAAGDTLEMDVFVGGSGGGNVIVGTTMFFGMVYLGP